MKNPLISVIIPCFNYGAYLQKCLQSVFISAQNIPKEIIVVDDGSTDNTREIARQFQEHITYIFQENTGLSAARNTGMQHATGKYLLFLDADDLLAPNTIPVQTSILETQPDVDIAICQTREVLSMGPDGPLAPIGFWWLVRDSIPLHLCHFNIAPPHAYIIRRHRALENGFFDTTLRACEDYDFWFRCAVRGMQFSSHAQTYVVYRKHAKSMSANKKNQIKHDIIMHHRTFKVMQKWEFAQNSYQIWIAHALGCAITALRCAQENQKDNLSKIIGFLLASLQNACQRIHFFDDSCSITQYYLAKLKQHLLLLKRLRDPSIQSAIHIIQSLHPDLPQEASALAKIEATCMPLVHHPQSYTPPPAVVAVQPHRKRILLGSDFFWPSLGGCEIFLQDLGSQLVREGYEVHVATRQIPERQTFQHHGVHILQWQCSGRFHDTHFGDQYAAYAHFLEHANYHAAFFLGQPDSWMHAPILSTSPRTPIHLIPVINPELVQDWIARKQEALIAAVLHRARSCMSLTPGGLDAQFLRAAGVHPIFVPHALTPYAPNPGFRERHGLSPDLPLLVHVGNFWPVKNQLGLIEVLSKTPGTWQMVFIGAALPWPHEQHYFAAVKKLAAQDPRIRILGPLPAHEADAAIAEADILLLSSHAECRPLVILQAMHHGTPWIATPQCNSVHWDAGGVVCPLEQFPRAIHRLLERPALRKALGVLGTELWNACFSWEKVLPLFLQIIEEGRPQAEITLPADLLAATQTMAKKILG